ncbi:hypothetical protein NE237_026260 [Protea cynaroides]|uniref:Transcription repressor n=1 Tax=Protea cynaroides TaxID=273540 RepID=A0A9Q0K0B5_9MAGN|nr:hypothetical protein NE237_026260 [Protea cynaroides]
MPKGKSFQKSLQIYLSNKFKKPMPTQLPIHPNSINSSSNWILSGCSHPKTSSFSVNRTHKDGNDDDDNDDVTLTDIDRFLCMNFNFLYCDTSNNGNEDRGGQSTSPRIYLFESPRLGEPPPEIRASNRFFVSTCASNSLLEEYQSCSSLSDDIGSSSITLSDEIKSLNLDLPDDRIAVITITQDPYQDFQQSMEVMVEAKLNQHEVVDWNFMEELLLCYLKLNEKKFYKDILEAFVDLIVILRQNSGGEDIS